MMDINEITYQIRGAVFEVNRVLGAWFLEKVYEKALLVELRRRGLKAESQIPITVKYKDEVVGEYFADVVVEDKVIIELKAVEQLQKIHEAQILNYLKATGYELGLLINFTHPKAEIKRFIIQPPRLNRLRISKPGLFLLATDTHRLTRTFIRRTSPDKNGHRFAKNACVELLILLHRA